MTAQEIQLILSFLNILNTGLEVTPQVEAIAQRLIGLLKSIGDNTPPTQADRDALHALISADLKTLADASVAK